MYGVGIWILMAVSWEMGKELLPEVIFWPKSVSEDFRAQVRVSPQSAIRGVIANERELRGKFEAKYPTEIAAFLEALGAVLVLLDRAEAPAITLPQDRAKQQVMTFLLIHRSINDMFAAFELFSCGFLYAAKNMMRSASEAYATGVLVSFDREIFEQYHKGRWDVSSSLVRLRRRKDLPIPTQAVDSIIAAYIEWSANVHPTFKGIHELSPKKGTFVGGVFHQDGDPSYRTFLKNIRNIAVGVQSFLSVRFIQEDNPLHVQRR